MSKQKHSATPRWHTLVDQLIIQCERDTAAKRRRIAKEKAAKHRLFSMNVRAHIKEL